jgi:hypothetical protein
LDGFELATMVADTGVVEGDGRIARIHDAPYADLAQAHPTRICIGEWRVCVGHWLRN